MIPVSLPEPRFTSVHRSTPPIPRLGPLLKRYLALTFKAAPRGLMLLNFSQTWSAPGGEFLQRKAILIKRWSTKSSTLTSSIRSLLIIRSVSHPKSKPACRRERAVKQRREHWGPERNANAPAGTWTRAEKLAKLSGSGERELPLGPVGHSMVPSRTGRKSL